MIDLKKEIPDEDDDGFLVRNDDSAAEANKLVKSILKLVEDLPEEAEEFGDSVSSKALSIQEWVESKGKATEPQLKALENMEAGLERWNRSRDDY